MSNLDKYPWMKFKSNNRFHFIVTEGMSKINSPTYGTICGKSIVAYSAILSDSIPSKLERCPKCYKLYQTHNSIK